jgi:acyl-coenzyme A thioesterase 9
LKPSTSQEIELYRQRDENATARKKKLISPQISDICETKFKNLVEDGQAAEDMPSLVDPNSILMRKTQLENIFICQPQNVNTAGRIFGGFLMHRAYDLAHATCYSFAGAYPHFKEVDEISFKKPVDIGDLVRLKSKVVYTSNNKSGDNKPIVQIEVTCHVVKPESHSSYISNTFDFIFQFDDNLMKPLKAILPSTNAEARLLISASNNRSKR